MELLKKYGVGPNIRHYVANIWEDQRFFCKQGGLFIAEIDVERGVTQGGRGLPSHLQSDCGCSATEDTRERGFWII